MRSKRLELRDRAKNSSKFYEVGNDDSVVHIHYGRIGTAGAHQVKSFSTASAAAAEVERLIKSKIAKGYKPTGKTKDAQHEQVRAWLKTPKTPKAAKGKKKARASAPGLSVQLLQEWDGETMPENAVVEAKLDGLRCAFVIAGDRYCAWSRNGKPFHNVGHIAAELMKSFNGYVLDGELVGDDWAGAMSAVRSGETGDTSATFVVFDALTHAEFDSKSCTRSLTERRKDLERRFPKNASSIVLMPQRRVRTPADVMKAMKGYVKTGFEGAVLKDVDAPYEFKRSSTWTKVKPFKSGDYKIVGTEEGSGKNMGMLGALMVKGPKGKVSGVGTGFTDAQRKALWKKRKSLIGKTVEVEYQEVNPSGGLRFPSFRRIRDDK